MSTVDVMAALYAIEDALASTGREDMHRLGEDVVDVRIAVRRVMEAAAVVAQYNLSSYGGPELRKALALAGHKAEVSA